MADRPTHIEGVFEEDRPWRSVYSDLLAGGVGGPQETEDEEEGVYGDWRDSCSGTGGNYGE